MAYTYDHPRPALTVDCVVFGYEPGALRVLLMRRELAPHAGEWALPGGSVELNEELGAAARRELEQGTGARPVYLEQLGAFGALTRDPRERVVTVAYYGLVRLDRQEPLEAGASPGAAWFGLDEVPELAFDHAEILDSAALQLRTIVRRTSIAFELLPASFTLRELQELYESVLDEPLDKRNFRRKLLSMGLLQDTGRRELGVSHRAARLYSFDRERHEALARDGLEFRL